MKPAAIRIWSERNSHFRRDPDSRVLFMYASVFSLHHHPSFGRLLDSKYIAGDARKENNSNLNISFRKHGIIY
jgi:hypothetical protein